VGQRAAWALVIGADGADPDQVRILDLRAGDERMVSCRELLADPRAHFPGAVLDAGGGDA
jgi:hypothetical protein